MEQYLGPSVLAKLQSLDDEDFEAFEGEDAAEEVAEEQIEAVDEEE